MTTSSMLRDSHPRCCYTRLRKMSIRNGHLASWKLFDPCMRSSRVACTIAGCLQAATRPTNARRPGRPRVFLYRVEREAARPRSPRDQRRSSFFLGPFLHLRRATFSSSSASGFFCLPSLARKLDSSRLVTRAASTSPRDALLPRSDRRAHRGPSFARFRRALAFVL